MKPAIGFKIVTGSAGKFKWDGKPKRCPKKGEWYLSGALVSAYQAPNDLSTEYFIAVKVG